MYATVAVIHNSATLQHVICIRITPPQKNRLYAAHDFSCSHLFYIALYWSGAEGYFFQRSLYEAFFSRPQWHNGPSV